MLMARGHRILHRASIPSRRWQRLTQSAYHISISLLASQLQTAMAEPPCAALFTSFDRTESLQQDPLLLASLLLIQKQSLRLLLDPSETAGAGTTITTCALGRISRRSSRRRRRRWRRTRRLPGRSTSPGTSGRADPRIGAGSLAELKYTALFSQAPAHYFHMILN